MAQDPLAPKDDGKVGLPSIGPGQNKLPPDDGKDGSKSDNDDQIELTPAEEAKLLAKIRKRFTRCIDAESENRKAALDDLKFKKGEQWPGDVVKQRGTDQRPCLTINKIPVFVHQVTNDIRQNRPQIKVSPIGDAGDVKVAKTLYGMIRAIERDSQADIAYDTAVDQSVSTGLGYWRILTDYEAPDTMDQVLKIQRIRNAFTVYLDPNHTEPDGADAQYAFVAEMVPEDDFEDLYPDASKVPFPLSGIGEKGDVWREKNSVRVAEYFEIKKTMRALVQLDNGHTGWEDELHADVKDDIAAGRVEVLKRRESQCPTVRWFKVSALSVLESREWPSQYIPVVKVIGDEVDVEGRVSYSGVIRFAKDPQRMYNYWRTLQTEKVALAPKAKWLVEEGQVEDWVDEWRTAHTSTQPFLRYKAVGLGGSIIGPPQRQGPEPVDAAVENSIQGAALDMMATTGIRFENPMDIPSKTQSGKAVRELKRPQDVGSFHYLDNFTRSLRRCGTILIDMIPRIYDTKRIVTILREDDKEEQVQIDPSAPQPHQMTDHPVKSGQKIQAINFTTQGQRYGVTVTVGPSFATRRQEAAESLLEFARTFPKEAGMIVDLIAKNQDWPGAEEMQARLAKMIPPQLLQASTGDLPPQAQALIQSMQQQIQQLVAQLKQAMMALKDKNADRQVDVMKITKDFEAKVLGVIQKAEASYNQQIGQHVKTLTHHAAGIHQALTDPGDAGLSPPAGVTAGDTGADAGFNPGAS